MINSENSFGKLHFQIYEVKEIFWLRRNTIDGAVAVQCVLVSCVATK